MYSRKYEGMQNLWSPYTPTSCWRHILLDEECFIRLSNDKGQIATRINARWKIHKLLTVIVFRRHICAVFDGTKKCFFGFSTSSDHSGLYAPYRIISAMSRRHEASVILPLRLNAL
jgi:hypothetical protein